jgi:hypothetical protein
MKYEGEGQVLHNFKNLRKTKHLIHNPYEDRRIVLKFY